MNKRQTFIDRLWKDSSGKQAVIAWPNIPLIGWLVCMLVGKFATAGKLQLTFDFLSFGFLFTWSWLEIFSGDSYFRRVLGLGVLILATYNKVK